MFSVTYPTGFEDERGDTDFSEPSKILGCVLWLKAADDSKQYAQYGLTSQACNHPCLVVDSRVASTEQDIRFTICIITSFKHKTSEQRAVAIDKASLVPIFPNDVASSPARRIELQSGARLRRDSWIQTARRYHVPPKLLAKYDRHRSEYHFRLTKSSISEVRAILKLPACQLSPTVTSQPASTQSNRLSQPRISVSPDNTYIINKSNIKEQTFHPVSRTAQDTNNLPLRDSGRQFSYGTYVSFSQDSAQYRYPDLEAYNTFTRPSTRTGWLRSSLDQNNAVSPFTQSMQSRRRFNAWLPSRKTVEATIFILVIAALAGGVGYGVYLLGRLVYMFLGSFCKDAAMLWHRGLAAASGLWMRIVGLVKGLGSAALKFKTALRAVVAKVTGAAKALLGR